MCQLIVKREGLSIDRETLACAFRDNPDGAGFVARLDNGSLVCRKGFFDFASFYAAYLHYEACDLLIHFRFATHGEVSKANCHPFQVAPDCYVGHNGVLSAFTPLPHDLRSDTRIFCEEFLAPKLTRHAFTALQEESISERIYTALGTSKLAFLTSEGFLIYNEQFGEWDEGVWYSAGKPEPYAWLREAYAYDEHDHVSWGDSYWRLDSEEHEPDWKLKNEFMRSCREWDRPFYNYYNQEER